MTKREYKAQIWKDYLEKRTDLAPEQRAGLALLGGKFHEDVSFLYAVHACVLRHGGAMEDEKSHVRYEVEESCHLLRWEDRELAFEEDTLKRLLEDMIGLFEDILPLGSVVDLKKEFLMQTMPLDNVEHVRMVITKRFLGFEKGYYPYAAVVYPIGMGGRTQDFCFSSALIGRVVMKGYTDDVEDAFIDQMKRKVILTDGRKSFGFATEEEQRELKEQLMQEGESNGGDNGTEG